MNDFYANCSDENILLLVREHQDESAFAELYKRYFPELFNYVYSKVNDRFSAQEVVQELFVSIWQQRADTLVGNCRVFLFSAAKKRIISFYRCEFTRRRHYDQWAFDSTALASGEADEQVIADDLSQNFERALRLLPPKCQEVFVLSRRGLSNKQIAGQLAISDKTVEQHISKALRILRSRLREHMIYMLLFFHFC
ncbi:RNA polymerase sigma factor [Dyadobacter sandarakinus]|uniref:Sigma-70 family RNA polymerase sigma factor n=1 Tax=Dyadobacter sandarakinus TaxID=2747268 RepID=A0ABX7I511_9BACT|nr:sigma-70 family RNA polymerase sigma factor [Dyadobacter sandarakinus]QRR01025.1 sigma-70 family RNA polymerase sigma factor [Dyadobacter sandarakinus]